MSLEKVYNSSGNFIGKSIDTLLSVFKIIFRSKFFIRLPETKNETCIVLGNGPSLNTSLQKHSELFDREPLVCVNNFSTTDEYVTLKPAHYVLLDSGYWLGEGKAISDTIESIKTKTTWTMHLFLPRAASRSKRFKELCEANKNIQLHYFNYTVFKGFSSIAHLFYSGNLAMPQSQNVLVASLFLAINMGFKKIIMVGADHTWHQTLHVDENNVLCLKHIHFYDNAENVEYVPFKKGTHVNETFKVHEIFETWGKTFYGYIALEKYAMKKKCKIINASEISFIDAFERKKL